jgi:hypothetical protein
MHSQLTCWEFILVREDTEAGLGVEGHKALGDTHEAGSTAAQAVLRTTVEKQPGAGRRIQLLCRAVALHRVAAPRMGPAQAARWHVDAAAATPAVARDTQSTGSAAGSAEVAQRAPEGTLPQTAAHEPAPQAAALRGCRWSRSA